MTVSEVKILTVKIKTTNGAQQWTAGPSDGEMVPIYGEMLHPT